MFSKEERYSFKEGYPKAKIDSAVFTLRYKHNSLGSFRCAVVVGKRVDKRATVRNRVKRVFIEKVKKILEGKKVPFDMVFFLKSRTLDNIDEELKKILMQAYIL